ncbi:MAG: hypothetical protein K2X47_03910, partial [Bdellovibrionales bacterium]|nr:hypothetical protein [Bdellovibrionales bacterium]
MKKATQIQEKMIAQLKQKTLEQDLALHKKIITEHTSKSGHAAPTSRRDFLRSGVTTASFSLLGPSLMGILGRLEAASAASCPVPAAPGSAGAPVPFIHIHLEGGSQILASATPRTISGSKIDNYSRLGLGAAPSFKTDLFPNQGTSVDFFDNGPNLGFYRGIMAGAPNARNNAALITVPYSDNGDSSDEEYSALGLINAAGRGGTKLGFMKDFGPNAATGVAGKAAFDLRATVAPVQIADLKGLINSIQLSGTLTQLNPQQRLTLSKAIQDLSAPQTAKIAGLNGGGAFSQLRECALGQNQSKTQQGDQRPVKEKISESM